MYKRRCSIVWAKASHNPDYTVVAYTFFFENSVNLSILGRLRSILGRQRSCEAGFGVMSSLSYMYEIQQKVLTFTTCPTAFAVISLKRDRTVSE